MEKVASETTFLPKVAVNIADLNRGQFVRGERRIPRWFCPTGMHGIDAERSERSFCLAYKESVTIDAVYLGDFFSAFLLAVTSLMF